MLVGLVPDLEVGLLSNLVPSTRGVCIGMRWELLLRTQSSVAGVMAVFSSVQRALIWERSRGLSVFRALFVQCVLRPENQGRLYSIPLMDWLADKYKDACLFIFAGGTSWLTGAASSRLSGRV